ncbi:MAG: transglutaminase domain-containing protein [Syntrophomonadaceae bacterium]|jgi:hypothetical protein
MKKSMKVITLSVCYLLLLSCLPCAPVEASYNIGFNNHKIRITSPQANNMKYSGMLTITGTSSLPEVWFCTRGPAKELAAYKADVQDSSFSIDIPLRFGPGEYTVWAGDNSSRFDGSIRFLVHNQDSGDTRFVSASNYIDSNDERIVALAEELNLSGQNDREKVQIIHDWIAANISYDCEAYFQHQVELNYASSILEQRKGLCRDFAFLFAALSRHSGVPCKVVYGQAIDDYTGQSALHAWNEVFIDGEWQCVDVTWDAGYINGSVFIQSPSNKYLTVDRTRFALSHTPTMVAAH